MVEVTNVLTRPALMFIDARVQSRSDSMSFFRHRPSTELGQKRKMDRQLDAAVIRLFLDR